MGGGGRLNGFTIRGGYGYLINGNTAVFSNGGTITNCVFEDNPVVGLLTYGSNTISDCVFRDHGYTGARIEPGGQTILDGCTFENGTGNGLYLYNDYYGDAHLRHEVRGCVFRGNGFAALYADSESPLVEGCLFVDNDAPAVWLETSSSMVRDCTIVGNRSDSNGAIYFGLSGHPGAQNACVIRNCVVAFNSCVGVVSGVTGVSTFDLNCVFGNAGGDTLPARDQTRANIFEDPLFCDLYSDDYTFCENSPCLTANDPVGITMGAYADAPGCDTCGSPVETTSWGAIKALYRESAQPARQSSRSFE